MFGLIGKLTAANLFNIIACLQEYEGVRLQVETRAYVLTQVPKGASEAPS